MVVWTLSAKKDLKAIREYISKDSPFNAQRVVAAITKKVSTLDNLPTPGKKVPEFNNEKIRQVSVSSWRVIYHVGQHRISIVTIIHKRKLLHPEDVSIL